MTATRLEQADLAAAAAAMPSGKSRTVDILGTLSDIADQPPLFTLCGLTLAAGLVRRDARLARAGAAMLAAMLVATGLKNAVKHRVDRTRPRAVAAGEDYAMAPGDSHDSDDNSFPSGHTAGAVAVAGALGRAYPAARPAAYGAAAAAALVQIPRGKHYPSDLAVGAAIGLVAAALVGTAADALATALGRYRVGTGSAPE